jgi:hypothetical protein
MSPQNEKPVIGADERLQALLAAYRETYPDPEPGPDFMPQLWQKIDASRSFTFSLRRLARGIITAAAAAALLMGVILTQREANPSPSYLELLAAGHAHNDLADTEIIQALHENSR